MWQKLIYFQVSGFPAIDTGLQRNLEEIERGKYCNCSVGDLYGFSNYINTFSYSCVKR